MFLNCTNKCFLDLKPCQGTSLPISTLDHVERHVGYMRENHAHRKSRAPLGVANAFAWMYMRLHPESLQTNRYMEQHSTEGVIIYHVYERGLGPRVRTKRDIAVSSPLSDSLVPLSKYHPFHRLHG